MAANVISLLIQDWVFVVYARLPGIYWKHKIVAVATHNHYDHIGCHHEFEVRAVHKAEVDLMNEPQPAPLFLSEFGDEADHIIESGYTAGEDLIKALPFAGFDPHNYHTQAGDANLGAGRG